MIRTRYGAQPTRAEMRTVVLAGDNNTAPGTRNTDTQPLSAVFETVAPAEYNVKSTAVRHRADTMHRRPQVPPTSSVLMGNGPSRAPERLAKGEKITRARERYNPSQTKFIAGFDLARLQGPTLGDIYRHIKPVAATSYAERAEIGRGQVAVTSEAASASPEIVRARAEKLFKLAADAVRQFGLDYQPMLDEAEDILTMIDQATINGAEIPPSVVLRLEVLQKGISGQLGERVGLPRGVSPGDIRTIVTDVVSTVAGPLGPQIADLATIVADLAASIPASNTVIADLVATVVAAVTDAAVSARSGH
jgi:hypothetical protein